jgi:cell division transport system ATP-binding protein
MRQRDIPVYRRKIGFVFQDFRLLVSRTVYENVAFAAEAVEMLPQEVRRRVPAMLEMVGLTDKQKSYPHQLSGGEQQRVCIARAMVNNPMMIIADEPTGDLDPEMSHDIMEMFQAINSRGTTMLIITHDKEMVDLLKKRVVRLDKGKIVRDEERGTYHSAH